jgi:transposase
VPEIGTLAHSRARRKELLDVVDWAEIRRLHKAEGLSIKEVARLSGVARNTVRAALRSDVPPAYSRQRSGSVVDAVEPEVKKLLEDFPRMPANVIAERIGWQRGTTVLRDRVAELRPAYLPVDPCQRTEYRPGELAQWDIWFPEVDIPVVHDQVGRFPVMVGGSGYSRFLAATMVPSREAHDVLSGHLAGIKAFGAVPRTGVYDQEGCIGRWRCRVDLHRPDVIIVEGPRPRSGDPGPVLFHPENGHLCPSDWPAWLPEKKKPRPLSLPGCNWPIERAEEDLSRVRWAPGRPTTWLPSPDSPEPE